MVEVKQCEAICIAVKLDRDSDTPYSESAI